MLKKIFAWALVLAMVLTMMPMMDAHNHAVAEGELPCSECDCKNFSPVMLSFCTCGHKKNVHKAHVHAPYVGGHTDSTCMKQGWDKYVCDGCDLRDYEYLPIVPDAHNFVNGVCNNTDDEGNVCGDTHNHVLEDYVSVVPGSVKEGNCNTPTIYEMICGVCGGTGKVEGDTVPDKHNWENGVCLNGCTVECKHEAYADGKCAECGKPHEHADADWTKVEGSDVAATCVAPNTWTEECKVCGATKTCEGEVDLVNGHTWAPNGQCANTGCNKACTHTWADGKCTKCQYECKHTETTDVTTKAATCKKAGIANVVCDTCDKVTGTTPLEIDPDAHDWIVFGFGAGYCVLCGEISTDDELFEDVLPEPEEPKKTCPENEHEWVAFSFGGWYCFKCGTIATDLSPLDPEKCNHADTYMETVKAATCKKPGVAKEICDICEEVLNENVVLPVDKDNGHSWIVFSFGGAICELCNEITIDESKFEEPENPQDTCEHDWYQVTHNGYFCAKCGKITTDENEVNPPVEEPEEPKKTCPENEHEWVAFSFGGWYCWKCDTYATDIDPLEPDICNHADTYIDVTTPATCKTPGVGNKMCDICETMMEEGVEVPVDTENGHKWVQDTYCELCGETKPAKPEDNCDHDWIYFSFGGLICKNCMKIALVNCKADEHYTDNGKCAACGALKGDVIRDGNIDNRDVLKALQMKGGAPTWAADMNDDGTIDNRDVLAILRSK